MSAPAEESFSFARELDGYRLYRSRMRRGWIFVLVLILAGCASQPARESASVYDPRFVWPEWTPTALTLLELKENAGYTVGPSPAVNIPTVGASSPPSAPAVVPPPPAPIAVPPTSTPKVDVPQSEQVATEQADIDKKVSFAASADGTPPFFYKWRKDGVAMPGKTDAVLTIERVKASDAGIYDCIVSNSAGEKASQPIKLVVGKP